MNAATPVTGAFLLVAYADGRYDPREEGRFLSTIANDKALGFIDTGALQAAYNSLLKEIEGDYAAAAEHILDDIAAAKKDPAIAAAVRVAARGAVVADNRIARQEELMTSRIAEALGLEAGAL